MCIINTKEILLRAKIALGANSETQLADLLGITKSALSNWKSRNSIDYKILFTKCEHIDYNWLIKGVGEMTLTSQEPQTDNDTAVLKKEIELLRERIADKDSEIDFLKSLLKK